MDELLSTLKKWRKEVADREGIELFRVVANKTLEEIAEKKPKTKEDFLKINGIKEKKFDKYGYELLKIINDEKEIKENITGEDRVYTINEYLGFLNREFFKYHSRVKGEISSFKIQGSAIYFSLKDSVKEGVLDCFMWWRNYEICALEIEVGMEVIVEGMPNIYVPNGRFNFSVNTIELVGEGALKLAYDKLKKKLTAEGLLAVERKKTIPELPEKIGLITSETGAVIHDFLTNIGKYGFKIKFFNSRVEGQLAIKDLLKAIEYFKNQDIDVLVIIRGGGSFESLQAFNNEVLVRKIAEFEKPVICGIGHDKDIPLSALAADLLVSTPTAVTTVLNRSWETLINDLSVYQNTLVAEFESVLEKQNYSLQTLMASLLKTFDYMYNFFENLKHMTQNYLIKIEYEIKDAKQLLKDSLKNIIIKWEEIIRSNEKYLENIDNSLKLYDPTRQLKLGYSIVKKQGKVLKSKKQAKLADELEILLVDGTINTKINKIN